MKIVVTGAESSGKTSLITDLAQHLETNFVDEYSRKYLLAHEGEYGYHDLVSIAKGQHNRIQEAEGLQDLVLVDTDLLTIKIWSEYKYDKCDPWIMDALEGSKPDLYLLCSPDIPWESDPLRENQYDRVDLHKIYLDEIIKLEVPYVEISGDRKQRLNQSLKVINELIS